MRVGGHLFPGPAGWTLEGEVREQSLLLPHYQQWHAL